MAYAHSYDTNTRYEIRSLCFDATKSALGWDSADGNRLPFGHIISLVRWVATSPQQPGKPDWLRLKKVWVVTTYEPSPK